MRSIKSYPNALIVYGNVTNIIYSRVRPLQILIPISLFIREMADNNKPLNPDLMTSISHHNWRFRGHLLLVDPLLRVFELVAVSLKLHVLSNV